MSEPTPGAVAFEVLVVGVIVWALYTGAAQAVIGWLFSFRF